MGHFTRGDVVIAPVAIEEQVGIKTRPAVVIGTGGEGEVFLCPVSSKPSSDTPSVPISLDDFSEGGLDLFQESFVLTSRVFRIPVGRIIGKKGRLDEETTSVLPARVQQSQQRNSSVSKKTRPGAGK